MADHAARITTLSADAQELKSAFAQLVRAFGGQEAVAATFAGVRQQKVSDWCNPRLPDFPPMQVIAHLEGCTVGHAGHPHVTRLLSRRAGFLLVERADDGVAPCPLRGLADMVTEMGDLSRAIGAAMADGVIDEDERTLALSELRQLEERTAAMRVALGGSKTGRRKA